MHYGGAFTASFSEGRLELGNHLDCVKGDVNGSESTAQVRELHKFGGSSLADTKCFKRVANIIRDYCGPADLFVVSAAGKTTNRLIEFVDLCGHEPKIARKKLESLFEYQLGLVNDLLKASEQRRVAAVLRTEFTWIRMHSEECVKEGPVRNRILGHGEVWSARLLASLLSQMKMPANWVDARRLLRAEAGPQPVIQDSISRPKVQSKLAGMSGTRVVITGYMASNGLGDTVLLGRNGSDYSATMIGILAGVQQITIWSDVAGVYSADPRKIESADLLPSISLREANELANLGASVLHRRSLQPVIEHQVTVALRSSYEPESKSTTLHRDIEEYGPKVVTTLDKVVLLDVELSGTDEADAYLDEATQRLALSELQPLAGESSAISNRLSFVFPSVLADAAYVAIREMGLSVNRSTDDLGLVAVVGAGSGVSSTTYEAFMGTISSETGHPPILVTQTDLSLFAVVRSECVLRLAERLHDELTVGCATSDVCHVV